MKRRTRRLYSKVAPARRLQQSVPRFVFAKILAGVAFLAIVARLFVLMVMQHGFYTALAAGSHEFYAQLFPERAPFIFKIHELVKSTQSHLTKIFLLFLSIHA